MLRPQDLTLTAAGASAPGVGTLVSSAQHLPGTPTQIVYGNGTTQVMQYDTRYRLTRNALTGPAGTLLQHDYGFDGAGNITAITDALDPGYNRTFDYDDLNRLTVANTGAALWGTGSYAYDAMGNLQSAHLGDPALTPLARQTWFRYAGTTPKLSAVRDTPLPDDYGSGLSLSPKTLSPQSVTNGSLTYDGAGNELSYVVTRSYSARNLMESVTNPGEVPTDQHTLTYRYDGRGVRVVRGESQQSGAVATRYYTYSPELQLLATTTDDAPNVWGSRLRLNATLPPRHELVWFGGRPLVQLSSTFTDGPHWYLTDHLGTPLLQTNAAGSTVWHAEYEPYGEVWKLRAPVVPEEGPSPIIDQPLRFPGQEVAMNWEGVEERYNMFRWYRAGWGQYTQADPAGLAAGLNLYGYALGNPNSLVDPLGAEPKFPQFPPSKTDGCKAEEWKYCEGKCSPQPVVGCYVTITHKLKTVKGFPQFGLQRIVNCNCKEDDCEKSWPDKLKDWWKEFTDPNKPPLPPLIPIPPKLPTPKPVIPGLPPFFINPCMLNPSLCDDGTGIA